MAWDVEGTKRKIIESATAEFVAHGEAGTTVERIAKRAGVNKERIYNYYGGKPELFAAVMQEKIAESLLDVREQPRDIDDVGAFEGQLFDYNRQRPELLRLLMWEALSATDPVVDQDDRVAMYARRTEEIQRGQRAGTVTDALSPELMHLMLLSLTGYAVLLPQVVRMIAGDVDAATLRAATVEAARRLARPQGDE